MLLNYLQIEIERKRCFVLIFHIGAITQSAMPTFIDCIAHRCRGLFAHAVAGALLVEKKKKKKKKKSK
jgi:hypothetical protein